MRHKTRGRHGKGGTHNRLTLKQKGLTKQADELAPNIRECPKIGIFKGFLFVNKY